MIASSLALAGQVVEPRELVFEVVDPSRLRIEALLARWRVTPEWMGSSATACGVVNGYAVPEQLGADRWASLVAARGVKVVAVGVVERVAHDGAAQFLRRA